jgi:hypothetical protein
MIAKPRSGLAPLLIRRESGFVARRSLICASTASVFPTGATPLVRRIRLNVAGDAIITVASFYGAILHCLHLAHPCPLWSLRACSPCEPVASGCSFSTLSRRRGLAALHSRSGQIACLILPCRELDSRPPTLLSQRFDSTHEDPLLLRELIVVICQHQVACSLQ